MLLSMSVHGGDEGGGDEGDGGDGGVAEARGAAANSSSHHVCVRM